MVASFMGGRMKDDGRCGGVERVRVAWLVVSVRAECRAEIAARAFALFTGHSSLRIMTVEEIAREIGKHEAEHAAMIASRLGLKSAS